MFCHRVSLVSDVFNVYAYVDLVDAGLICLSDFLMAAFVIGLKIPNKHNKKSPDNPLMTTNIISKAMEKLATSPIRYPAPSMLLRVKIIFNCDKTCALLEPSCDLKELIGITIFLS